MRKVLHLKNFFNQLNCYLTYLPNGTPIKRNSKFNVADIFYKILNYLKVGIHFTLFPCKKDSICLNLQVTLSTH